MSAVSVLAHSFRERFEENKGRLQKKMEKGGGHLRIGLFEDVKVI